jgi:hypothetical protein
MNIPFLLLYLNHAYRSSFSRLPFPICLPSLYLSLCTFMPLHLFPFFSGLRSAFKPLRLLTFVPIGLSQPVVSLSPASLTTTLNNFSKYPSCCYLRAGARPFHNQRPFTVSFCCIRNHVITSGEGVKRMAAVHLL